MGPSAGDSAASPSDRRPLRATFCGTDSRYVKCSSSVRGAERWRCYVRGGKLECRAFKRDSPVRRGPPALPRALLLSPAGNRDGADVAACAMRETEQGRRCDTPRPTRMRLPLRGGGLDRAEQLRNTPAARASTGHDHDHPERRRARHDAALPRDMGRRYAPTASPSLTPRSHQAHCRARTNPRVRDHILALDIAGDALQLLSRVWFARPIRPSQLIERTLIQRWTSPH